MSSNEEDLTPSDDSPLPNGNVEPTENEDSPSLERVESNKADTTIINKGPYGAVAILTIDADFLRSLGFNPKNVDELSYRPFNGAVLVEPVTQ